MKKRDSNIELLRIIAMFMVVCLHVNGLALGNPDSNDMILEPVTSIARFYFQSLCIMGVNIFVFISGWFGIKYKTKSLANYIFQALFFSIVIFIPYAVCGNIDLSRINILSALLLYKNAYWFFWAYLVLYILSPVLNSFVQNTDKGTFKRVLILMFIAQTLIFTFTNLGFYKAGYTPLFFIFLYLLARYFRLYYTCNLNKYLYLIIFAICVIINTILCISCKEAIISIAFAYTNPLNIIGALSFVIFFTKLSFKNKFINSIASSAFAVYLFHMHFCIYNWFISTAKHIYDSNSGYKYFVYIMLFNITVFITAIIIDKVRIKIFNIVWNISHRQ